MESKGRKMALNGMFIFKTIETLACKYYRKEFKYDCGNLLLNYHLQTNYTLIAHDEQSNN